MSVFKATGRDNALTDFADVGNFCDCRPWQEAGLYDDG
jgi:hypothetical protein